MAFIILTIFGFCQRCYAAADCLTEEFTITATAGDFATARQTALANGIKQAEQRVLNRLTLNANVTIPSPIKHQWATLTRLSEETYTAPHYKATARWCFDAKAIQQALTQKGVAHTALQLPKVLVVPVFSYGGINRLWQSDNRWFVEWQRLALDSDLPLIVPDPTITNKGIITASDALTTNLASLQNLQARYPKADTIVVITANVRGTDLEATLTQITQGEAKGVFNGITLNQKLTPQEGLDYAAAQVLAQMLARFREGDLFQPLQVLQFYEAKVCYTNLADWLRKKSTLANTPGVKELKVTSLTTSMARLKLQLATSVGYLRQNLKPHKLTKRTDYLSIACR